MRNLLRTLGLALLMLGALGIAVAAIDAFRAMVLGADDGRLHLVWMFFVGVLALACGRVLLLRSRPPAGLRLVDCASCGAINAAGAGRCSACDAALD